MGEPAAPQGSTMPSAKPSERRRDLFVSVGLLLLAIANLAPWTSRLGLLHDDWPLVHDMARGKVSVSSIDGLRPLLGVPWRLCGLLFGDRVAGYYAVLFTLQWLAATLLYLIARRFSHPGFAAALAALSMVYPADASHLWLSTLTQRTAWAVALAAILLAELARERPRLLIPSLALVLLSLGFYELQLFLLALWPALAWGLGAPWRRPPMLAWLVPPALYLAWRFVARPVLGASTVATADFSWSPLGLLKRALVLVPYNLFADGWLIGVAELGGKFLPVGMAFLVAVSAATLVLAPRWGAGHAPERRHWLVASALVVLGVAPILPTTYWLGRTAGTYGARILAAALPGAALLLLLGLGLVFRAPRARALAFSALLTVALAFHWNVGALAAENWEMQQQLARALLATGSTWPSGSFLAILDLPPNRLSYDTPWGLGRMIQETYGDPTLSGIGICSDRAPREILSTAQGELLVQGGFYARVPWSRVVVLRWRNGLLKPVASALLREGLVRRPG